MPQLRKADARRRAARALGSEYLESLERGISVLKAFDDQRRQLTLTDVSASVGLSKASARRALNTLAKLGYVKVDGRTYRIQPAILRLAGSYVRSNRISSAAQSVCERIVRKYDEGCSVAVLSDQDVVTVADAGPRRMQSIGAGIGYRLPASYSALGRAILSTYSEKELDGFLATVELRSLTTFSIGDRAALRAAILQSQEHGYSLVDQESDPGWRSIAVPIREANGRAVAAIGISARVEQLPLEALSATFLPVLRRAALELADCLGSRSAAIPHLS